MSGEFDLAHLEVPEGSEFHRLMAVCPGIEVKRFTDGQYLIREGDRSREVFLVLTGAYVVEQSTDRPGGGHGDMLAAVISGIDAPSFVGEMAYLGDTYRTASVRSSGTTYALCLSPEHLDVIMSEFSFFTRILCRQFSVRLKEANEILKETQHARAMNVDQVMKRPNEVLFARGDTADRLYQLIDGVLVCEDDQSVITPQNTLGGFVDPRPFFCDAAHEITVKTKGPALLAAIARESKLAVVRNYPELALSLL